MRYQGGKARIGKRIATVIQKTLDKYPKKTYIEPFVGAGGVLRHICVKKATICDALPDAILFWKALLNEGWLPKSRHVTESQFKQVKASNVPSAMRFFAGHNYSFGGYFLHGYAPSSAAKPWIALARQRDSIKENINRVQVCRASDYEKLKPSNAIIYCDPPYSGTTPYAQRDPFNIDNFWKVMRKWSRNNIVFVSSVIAPPDWQSVWSFDIKLGRTSASGGTGRFKHTTSTRREKLFVHKSVVNSL
jgi:DNA adenine methylase